MDLSRYLSWFRYKKFLLTELSKAECIDRIRDNLARPGLSLKTSDLFVGRVKQDKFLIKHRFPEASRNLLFGINLWGSFRADQQKTLVECDIGIPFPYLIAWTIFILMVLYSVFIVASSSIWFFSTREATAADYFSAGLGLVILCSIPIGIVTLARRAASKQGHALFRFLCAVLNGTPVP